MIDYDQIKEDLTPDDIIKIIQYFIPDVWYEQSDSRGCIVLPTICHNLYQEDGSKKLYYYYNTHLFHCYTHCGSFDIYELVKKMLALRERPDDFASVFNIISKCSERFFERAENVDSYKSIAERYRTTNNEPILKHYSENALACFEQVYPIEWIQDGLTIRSMQRYGIRCSSVNNQIIIPHYDINSELIGIRVRNLDEDQVDRIGKYMPARIEGQFYAHPLMYNLYGIHLCKDAIKRKKTALICEGEKSVMIADGWYGEDNCVVATCGDKINKFLVKQLVKLGVTNIIICYDRMNHDLPSRKIYFNKLYAMCERYKQYANFSFIFDWDEVLPYKAAPFDSGKETFERLLERRVIVK